MSVKVGHKVGLIVGREWSFPPRFIEEVNRRDRGVTAEFALLGGESMEGASPYTVLIDRISHEVPFYRAYLKHAALQGVVVVNNPFMWSADDKFFGATLATRLGVASPRTIPIPNKEYVRGIVHAGTPPPPAVHPLSESVGERPLPPHVQPALTADLRTHPQSPARNGCPSDSGAENAGRARR